MLNLLKKIFSKRNKSKNFYQIIGGDSGIQELVNLFYHTMEQDPYATDCLNTHDLEDGKVPPVIKQKLYFFISGWLGGPNLFVEKYGHPRMRKRHIHVKIGEDEKKQWLYCMNKALELHSQSLSKKNRVSYNNSFTALAMRIQNS